MAYGVCRKSSITSPSLPLTHARQLPQTSSVSLCRISPSRWNEGEMSLALEMLALLAPDLSQTTTKLSLGQRLTTLAVQRAKWEIIGTQYATDKESQSEEAMGRQRGEEEDGSEIEQKPRGAKKGFQVPLLFQALRQRAHVSTTPPRCCRLSLYQCQSPRKS